MKLEVFDKDSRQRVGIIIVYSYLTYEDVMDDRGNFEIRMPNKSKVLDVLDVGNYIWFEDGIVGIIKGKKDVEGEDTEISIYGYLVNEILNYRSFLLTTQYYDTIDEITKQMLNDLFIDPEDTRRAIDFITIQQNMPEFTGKIRVQNTGDTFSNYLAEMYFPYSLGFELYPIFSQTLDNEQNPNIDSFEFRLLKPVDRTYDNEDNNDPVIFSFDLSNLQSIEYEEDERNTLNVALVAAEGTGAERKTLEVGDTISEGIYRKELYVDARDIQSDADPENPLTDEELEELMEQRGQEKLQEHQRIVSFEASIIEGKYKYGVDFYKADFVSVIDKSTGRIYNVQVNSIKKSISNGVEHVDIIFGKDNLTISEMTKRQVQTSGGGGTGPQGPKGDKGDKGDPGTPGTTPSVAATASVDTNVGTPSVTVTRTGTDASPNFDFAFHNLKGQSSADNVVDVKVNGTSVVDVNKVANITMPTKVSDLQNDSGFISNTVNNLTNYYLKSETYTKTEVDTLIGQISTLHLEVVQVLPTQDISLNTIYLVPKQSAGTQNVYDEYIYVNNSWELIGDTEVDLSNYYTKTQTDTLLDSKVDKVSGKGLSTEDYTTSEKTKLSGIETGAQVNVQSDWGQTDNTADDYIKNKPTIPTRSGHAILNDAGTSLAQEDDLQFVGTYSEDDSANGKTKTYIAREMTLAEYNQLTTEQKKGIINVLDEPGGSGNFYRKPDDLQLSIVSGKLCITYDDGT